MADRSQSDELNKVLTRIMSAKDHVKGWKENIHRWRHLYDGHHYDSVPKTGEVRYNDPTYGNTVDLAVGIMLANQLVWSASGWSPSYGEQKKSSALEKFLYAAWCVNAEREESSLQYDLMLHFARDGGGAIFSVWDKNIGEMTRTTREVPDSETEDGVRPTYAFEELPLRIKVIDPDTMFMLPGGPKRWLVMGRSEERSVLDIEVMYNVQLADFTHMDENQKSITRGEFVDYWDYSTEGGKLHVRNCCLFNNKFVPGFELRTMDGYTDLPYTVQLFKPTEKTQSDKWQSIISPLVESVSLLERSVNRRQRQIDIYSSLPIVTKTHPGRPISVEGLGHHVNLSTDEDIGFPSWPGNAPDVQMQMDFFRARVQQSGFSDVMFGSGASQVTGYALSQLGDQNRIRLEQPVKHLELLFTSWAKKAIKLCAYFSSSAQVKVYGTMKGQDFAEWIDFSDAKEFVVRAEIRPKFPNEEVRRHAMATQARGVLSDWTIMERYLDIQQPDEEMERQQIEVAMKNPMIQSYIMMAELNKRAEDGDKVAAMVLQSMQSGGLPGTPGRPVEPNNPEQLMGGQSPTGSAMPTAPQGPDAQAQMEGMVGASPTMSGEISGY